MYKFDDHIKECDYRFQKLMDKADQVHERLDRLEQLVLELKVLMVKTNN